MPTALSPYATVASRRGTASRSCAGRRGTRELVLGGVHLDVLVRVARWRPRSPPRGRRPRRSRRAPRQASPATSRVGQSREQAPTSRSTARAELARRGHEDRRRGRAVLGLPEQVRRHELRVGAVAPRGRGSRSAPRADRCRPGRTAAASPRRRRRCRRPRSCRPARRRRARTPSRRAPGPRRGRATWSAPEVAHRVEHRGWIPPPVARRRARHDARRRPPTFGTATVMNADASIG